MRKSEIVFALLCTSALLAACDTSLPAANPYDPEVPAHQKEPATLTGEVRLENGDPTTATVEVQPAGKSTTPDATGRFSIAALPPGTYTIRVTAQGHSAFTQGGVFLGAGEQIDVGRLALLAARGSLSGDVLLMEGEDQEAPSHGGALVYVTSQITGRLAANAAGGSSISNPDGTWTLADVPVGTYRISGSKDEYVPSEPVVFEVNEDETTEVSTLVLRSVSGLIRIYAEDATGARHEDYASDPDVTVEVRGYNAHEMKISNQPDLDPLAWQPFTLEQDWSLVDQPGGADDVDGTKTVFAMFRNQDGFETPVVQDTIVLDRGAPVAASVRIADGAEQVTDAQVALTLHAEDALSGVAQMRIAIDGIMDEEPWSDYVTQEFRELPVGADPDGVPGTVMAQFRDGAGNETAVVQDTVLVDTVAPQAPTIAINAGATRTASTEVQLTLDAAGASEMKVSNDSGLAGAVWQPFAPILGWRLTSGDEDKTVYARFRDGAGNTSDIVSDSIELNTRGTVQGRILLEGAAADGHVGISVELIPEDAGQATLTESTDAQGTYTFASVLVGRYVVAASHPDFMGAQVPLFLLGPGGIVDTGTLTLSVSRGDLRGTAERAGATDHGGILIEVQDTAFSATTNAAGEYLVRGLPVGQYTVNASAEGYSPDSATDIGVQAESETQVPLLTLAANPGSVVGTVALEGVSAPDALGGVELVVAGQSAFSLDDGSFVVPDVPAGTYQLTATLAGYSITQTVANVLPGTPANVGTISLAIARGHLAGSAEREGEIDHAAILIEVLGTAASGATSAAGDWTIRDIPIGQYTVRASAEAFTPVQATDIVIVEGETTDVALLTLPANPGSVAGAVALEGQPAGAYGGVEMTLEGTGLLEVTQANGSYSFGAVPVGTYLLTARLTGFAMEQTLVTVIAGAQTDVDPMLLSIARGAIDGQATLAGAADHSGITVEIDGAGYAGITGIAGGYRIESVPVGTYSLTARKDGYVTNAVGNVTVLEDQTVTAAPVELVRQSGDFDIEERATGDQEYINDAAVKLVFTVVPGGSVDIWVAEDAGFTTGGWAGFSGLEHDHDLLAADGTVNVFAKFRDAIGTESPVFTASTVLDRVAPLPTSSVVIDSNAEYSTDSGGDVSLTLVAQDATSGVDRVRISVDGTFDAETDQGFSAVIAPVRVDTPLVDGEKTVWVEFVDRAGNRSATPASDSIYLDRAEPQSESIAINGGSTYAIEAMVTLTLSAEDVCAAGYPTGTCDATNLADPAQMMISNDPGFPGAQWEAYATSRAWFLTPGDGPKDVYVKFRDGAGNPTVAISDDIELDRTPPGSPQIAILGGEITGTVDVQLSLSATDTPTEMIFAENGDFAAATWEAYDPAPQNFTLSAGDGLKTVAAKFRDAASNESLVVSDTVTLDTAPPGGTLSIVEGEFVSAVGITLQLTASPDATRVCVYGDVTGACNPASAPGTWAVFASSLAADLTAGDGTKTVRVQLADAAGNQSAEISADTTLDSADPNGLSVTITGTGPAGYTRTSAVTLTLAASDATSGVAEMMLANDAAYSGASWQPYSGGASWTLAGLDGGKTVYFKVRDRALNEAETSAPIILDRAAPTLGTPTIDGGAAYTTATLVNVDLTGSDNLTAAGDLTWCLANNATFDAAVCGTGLDLVGQAWTLTDGDGEKTVYARVTDEAGHQTESSASILLDAEAPTGGSLLIDGGEYTTTTDVNLTLTYQGAFKMCLYGDITNPCNEAQDIDWIPAGLSASVVLSGVDGSKTVRVKFRDEAQNVTGEAWDTVTLDGAPPSGVAVTVVGDGPAGYSRTAAVTLQIAASDATSGLADMMVSESATFSGASWENFTTLRGWTLSGPDGAKTLYVRIRDRAGNFDDASDPVTLDTAAPQFTAGPAVVGDAADDRAGYTRDTGVTASFTVQDALEAEDTLTYCIANNPALDGATCGNPPANGIVALAWTLSTGEESKTVYFNVADPAGNQSSGSSSIVFDGTPPLSPTLVIDAADRPYTLDDQITVHLGAVGATQVHLSENAAAPGRDDAGWVAFDPGAPSAVFDLSDSEGAKIVYGYYQDPAGNVTAAAVQDGTFHDTTAPTGTAFTITGTSHYDRIADAPVDEPRDDTVATMTTTVSLTVAANDGGSGVTEMLLSNDSLFSGAAWEPYRTDIDLWALLGGAADYEDRTVYAKFRDAAGRESNTLNDTIKLDNTAPTGPTVSIEAGAVYVAGINADVTLTATAADYRQLSMDSAFGGEIWSAFTSPETVVNFDLGGEGTRTAYARFRDEVGNLSALASDSIIADDAAPTQASVSINGDAEFVRHSGGAVTLVLYAEDQVSGVDEMRFSNDDTTWSGWLPYATLYGPWTLDTPNNQNDVVKTVYAQFRDNAGQQTTSVSDTIRLDNVRPTIDAPGLLINADAAYTTEAVVILTLPATDAADVKVSNGSGCIGGTWGTYAGPTGTWVLEEGDDESRTVSAIVRDEAGNTSASCSEDSIDIDTVAPVVQTLTLDGCADLDGGDCEGVGGGGDGSWDPYYTNDRWVAIWVTVSGACQNLEMSDTSDFSGALNTVACSTAFPVLWNYAAGGADALRPLYVRAVDAAGNLSNVMQESVWKDNRPPKFPSVEIEGGVQYFDSPTVDLALYAQSDGSPMYQMFIDEDADPLDQTAVAYNTTFSGFVFSTTGLVTATVGYEDTAGNRTDAATHASDSIFIDTRNPLRPAITKICAAGEDPLTCPVITRTNNTEVLLVISAADRDQQAGDGGSGIAEMKIAEGADVASLNGVNWQPYAQYLSYLLPSDNGVQSLWVGVQDQVQRQNVANSAAQVVLDTEKPVLDGLILINNDDPFTQSVDVTMTSAVWDNLDSQANLEMAFLCTGRIDEVDGQPCVDGTWYPYGTSVALKLTPSQGIKNVWVAFRDRAGNVTGNFTDDIILDSQLPTGTSIYYISGGNRRVELAWNASLSGDVSHYKLYWDLDPGTVAADYANSIDDIPGTEYTHEGVENVIYTYHYRVVAVDFAGNESALSDEASDVPGWQVRRELHPGQFSGDKSKVTVGDDNTIWVLYSENDQDAWVTYCSADCWADASWTRFQVSADATPGNVMTVNSVPFIGYSEAGNAFASWCDAADCSVFGNWTTVALGGGNVREPHLTMGDPSNLVLLYNSTANTLVTRRCFWYTDCSNPAAWSAALTVDPSFTLTGSNLAVTYSDEHVWALYMSGNQFRIATCGTWTGCEDAIDWSGFTIDTTTNPLSDYFSITADDTNSHAQGRVMAAYKSAVNQTRIASCSFTDDCSLPGSWSTYYDFPVSPNRDFPTIQFSYDGLFMASQSRATYDLLLDFCYFGYDRAAGEAYCQDPANWHTTVVDDVGQTGYSIAMTLGLGMREPFIVHQVLGSDLNITMLPYDSAPADFFALPAPQGFYFSWTPKAPEQADGYNVVFDFAATVPPVAIPPGWTGGFHDLFRLGGAPTKEFLTPRDYTIEHQYLLSLKSTKDGYDTGASDAVYEVRPFEQVDFDNPVDSSTANRPAIGTQANGPIKSVYAPVLQRRGNNLELSLRSCVGPVDFCADGANWTAFNLYTRAGANNNEIGGNPAIRHEDTHTAIAWYDRFQQELWVGYCMDNPLNCQNPANWSTGVVATGIDGGFRYSAFPSVSQMAGTNNLAISWVDHAAGTHGVYLAGCDPTAGDCLVPGDWTTNQIEASVAGSPQYRSTSVSSYGLANVFVAYQMDGDLRLARCQGVGCGAVPSFTTITIDSDPDYASGNWRTWDWASPSLEISLATYRLLYDRENVSHIASCFGDADACSNVVNWDHIAIPGTREISNPRAGDRRLNFRDGQLFGLGSDENGLFALYWCPDLCSSPTSWRVGQLDDTYTNYFMFPQIAVDSETSINIVRSRDYDTTSYPNVLFGGGVRQSN